jgi:hypothetical protein
MQVSNLSVHLEEYETGSSLNKRLLSETKVHLLSFKEELSIYFLHILNRLIPLIKLPFTLFVVAMP